MRVREIVFEDISPEEQLSGDGKLSANLLPVLMFLKKRSEDKELSAKLRTQSLIQLVQNAGDTTFDYKALVNAFENNDAVKEVIKSFNREEIILRTDNDSGDGDSESHGDSDEHTSEKQPDPEKTVAAMAKKASKKRE